MGAEAFNLLAFLHRDNYPVASCFLTESEVTSYPSLSDQAKGDLIYARYTGLLVDPKSTPDSEGRYFDFSAVPIAQARFDQGQLTLPRVQAEELYHLQVLRHLAKLFGLELSSLNQIRDEITDIQERLPGPQSKALGSLLDELELKARRVTDSEKVAS